MGPLLGGIDEAGRGCLLGPLVVAGVAVDKEGLEELKSLGVRDSKKLSPRRRESLYPEILRVCASVQSVGIEPSEIDHVVRTGKKYRKLNYLEAVYFAKVIDRLEAAEVTVDASDSSPARFRDNIAENLNVPCRVKAVHKADRDFPVVSAASIIAKVERDQAVDGLRKKYGNFGSGYPSDPRTRVFFMEKMRGGYSPPDYARRSWKSWGRFEQALLASF
ncbi:MAG: ribonuclease HII [Thaumarchaeota archaeon]|nr:ribonuclease HII [Nitrososphaerota archaeon]